MLKKVRIMLVIFSSLATARLRQRRNRLGAEIKWLAASHILFPQLCLCVQETRGCHVKQKMFIHSPKQRERECFVTFKDRLTRSPRKRKERKEHLKSPTYLLLEFRLWNTYLITFKHLNNTNSVKLGNAYSSKKHRKLNCTLVMIPLRSSWVYC